MWQLAFIWIFHGHIIYLFSCNKHANVQWYKTSCQGPDHPVRVEFLIEILTILSSPEAGILYGDCNRPWYPRQPKVDGYLPHTFCPNVLSDVFPLPETVAHIPKDINGNNLGLFLRI